MQDLILTPLPVRELKTLIDESVCNAFQNYGLNKEKHNDSNEFLKIDEVCNLLKVSKVTIHTWKRKGLIPYHRISKRIYFKKEEVLQAIKKSNNRFSNSVRGEK